MSGYQGWKNYETWNVVLWLANDEVLYHAAKRAWVLRARHGSPYKALLALLKSNFVTGDGVSLRNRKVSRREVNEAIRDLALD